MRCNLIHWSFIVLVAVMMAAAGMAAEPISFWPFNGDLDDAIDLRDGTFNGDNIPPLPVRLSELVISLPRSSIVGLAQLVSMSVPATTGLPAGSM